MLSALMEHGALHRAELARICGLSRTTVSTIVADLVSGGVVIEVVGDQAAQAGIDASEVDGRARGFLRANPAAGAAAGLDFTLERVWCHLTDLSGRTLASEGVTATNDAPWQERLTAGLELLDGLLDRAGRTRDDLVGVAIGVAGPSQPRARGGRAALPGAGLGRGERRGRVRAAPRRTCPGGEQHSPGGGRRVHLGGRPGWPRRVVPRPLDRDRIGIACRRQPSSRRCARRWRRDRPSLGGLDRCGLPLWEPWLPRAVRVAPRRTAGAGTRAR